MSDPFVKGEYLQTIYKSNDGFQIIRIELIETNIEQFDDFVTDSIIVTGYFLELEKSEIYVFYGNSSFHKKYGLQFVANKMPIREKPEDEGGLVRFLSSGLFTGIGKKTAMSIVDTLGTDCLTLIKEDYNNLLLVPRMNRKRAIRLQTQLKSQQESSDIILYLTENKFSMPLSLKIYQTYKGNTYDIIEENPYQMINDIEFLGFETVDNFALNIGILEDDNRRIQAGIVYASLNICIKYGHTYLSKQELLDETSSLLKLINKYDLLNDNIDICIEAKKIICIDDYYYHPNIYNAEQNIATKLLTINTYEFKNKYSENKIDKIISSIEEEEKIIYDSQQKEAINLALNSNVMILTGGPGTGKTTTIYGILQSYFLLNKIDKFSEDALNRVALIAPTGRAAKRMSEKTNYKASTIHRFLKWEKDNNSFGFNESNLHSVEFLIIDETSMIDVWLLNNLLLALKSNCKIIFVGDYHQLPSVMPGDILKDMINSKVFNQIDLNVIHRQDNDSTITTFAHQIKDGILPENFLEKTSDRNFIRAKRDNVVSVIEKITTEALKKGYKMEDIQVLAPMYKTVCGIDRLNLVLKDLYNPPSAEKRELNYSNITFREGDRLLLLVNMVNNNVFNGDMGILSRIIYSKENTDKVNKMYIDFDGNLVEFIQEDFKSLRHAYAISIHKSQGSEFPIVIMPIAHSFSRMLYRRLIYTGITRAKKSLIIVGEASAFEKSLSKAENFTRQTNFKNILIEKSGNTVVMEEISPYDFM